MYARAYTSFLFIRNYKLKNTRNKNVFSFSFKLQVVMEDVSLAWPHWIFYEILTLFQGSGWALSHHAHQRGTHSGLETTRGTRETVDSCKLLSLSEDSKHLSTCPAQHHQGSMAMVSAQTKRQSKLCPPALISESYKRRKARAKGGDLLMTNKNR